MAGSGGMLGEAFYEAFREQNDLKCTDKDVNTDWLEFLDFREFDLYRQQVLEFMPDYLFHLGAYTDLEYCEAHEADAYKTNTISVEHATRIANELDIPLLYISTAGIFDGSQEAFDDWDSPNPLGIYARTKYLGERHVVENARRYLICRAGWMMGGGPKKDKKFIHKLMRQLKDGKTTLNIVDDKFGTPTYTHDFAANVRHLVENEAQGLFNLVCEGTTGRLEVATELIRHLDLSNEVRINAVGSDFFAHEYFAERPDSERLVNRRLDLYGWNKMRTWEICLSEYLDRYYDGYLEKGKIRLGEGRADAN